ncbi:MAG: type II/IV secretion system protein, partial [Desulfatitalea sp.]|nr:type II/IV secretion system protein [Desulfatitalea sp.]NNK00558.1 type II/IV secretion system protein [Desulfatitalea sp.]
MATNPQSAFRPEVVCQVLIKSALLTKASAKEILRKKDSLLEKLEQVRRSKNRNTPAGERISNPLTIIDVIVSLKLNRLDNPGLPLDEETIYQTMARHWNIPFYKIDPLKLDLNVVTSTIPRIFAMKHLVVPVDIADGLVTVAMPDPFNLEVLD